MKFDRGMIKWQPFNSVISSKYIIMSIVHEKEKINKPILSQGDVEEIEAKIIDAYYCQYDVTLQYYKSGYLQAISGKIKKIDCISKKIYLNNLFLFFNQIISIN